jgi:hypothetical protein
MGDADESYDFSETDRFVKKFQEGFELVTGCRLPRGGGKILPGAMPFTHRWFGNPLFSRMAHHMFAAPIHDVYCGLRGFTREQYDSLASNDHEASLILTLFGVPMRTCGGKWKIEQRLAINDSSRVNIDALVAELKEESRELAN